MVHDLISTKEKNSTSEGCREDCEVQRRDCMDVTTHRAFYL
jgi:hypothetical protein